jgi:serine/threonine protein kinase
MASVFYARLLGPSGFARTVAVKRPHPQLAREHDFAMMFIDEARVASRVRHPNVVSTLDVIETPSELALVMDYVHGESLSKLSAAARKGGERVPLAIAAAILIDSLHGLHAAHEAKDEQGHPLGIVHRDVSPQNVLVGADGITRIVDFGIAKAAGRLLTTRDGAVKGKYAYMAPEQIRGEALSRQTDIYAASILLWELLTGEGLFRGGSEAEEIYKCMEGVVEAPSRRDPSIPAAFDAIVLRGLARNPAERYPTARDMAADVERASPAVRPSEIGAWVQRLAGDALAARAAVIAEMEASGRDAEQESVGLPLTAASESPTSAGGRVRVLVPDREHSQLSHPGVVAERGQSATAGSRVPRRLALVAFGVILVLGTYGSLSIGRRSPPAAASNAPPPPDVIRNSPAAIPPRADAPVASTVASSPTGAPTKPAASASAVARPAARAPGRGSKQTPGCDPPYIVDSQGREIFKLQCL